MATIRTALAMYDGMTAPLMQMNRALHTVINSFEAMQTASSTAVDTSAIKEAREALASAEIAFDSIEREIRQADSQQEKFNRHTRDGAAAADTLLSKVKRIAAATGAGFAIQKLVDTSDQMVNVEARLKLLVDDNEVEAAPAVQHSVHVSEQMVNAEVRQRILVDDGGSVAELERKIMAAAQRSRSAYMDTASMIANLGQNAGAAFENNDELIAFAEQVNKMFKIGGASAAEQSAATMQLTQALAAGALRGDELNSILEGAPGIARAIESYMGVAEGSIKEYASEGLVTAEVVKNALFAAAEETNAKFAEMPMTWGQVFTVGTNVALQALNPLLDGINWLANNIAIIGPAVLGLGSAFLVFQIAAHWTQIAAAAAGVYNVVVGFLSLGFAVLTGNTWAAAMSVSMFNSVLLANPIVWVVMLITVLIGTLYAGVAAYNKFTDSGVSATGIITAAFGVMVAVVGNLLILFYNMFADAANFVGNVFNDPVAAVEVLFYNMAMNCLGFVSSMVRGIESLINKIPGVEIDITSGLDNLYAGLEQRVQQVKDASGWQEYVQRMDFVDYTDYARKGYDLGKGFADRVSGVLDFTGNIDSYNAVAALDGLYNAAADTAGNTARMADSLDISEENLAYMKDIAEREAINRFTTAEVKIEQHNENHIGSDLDADGIMDKWCGMFREQMVAGAEGVHT